MTYWMTLMSVKKHKENGDIEFAPVYFTSPIKTIINFKCGTDKSFQVILYRTDNWIDNWIIG